jgi:hydrogenase nickel incorporation protein HypA/HybF
MHELSIAQALIEAACEAAGESRVTRVFVRIGALAGVVPEALHFSFAIAAEDTACEGAVLEIEPVPLIVHCPECDAEQRLSNLSAMLCPACGVNATKIVSGRELDLVQVELVDHDPAHC